MRRFWWIPCLVVIGLIAWWDWTILVYVWAIGTLVLAFGGSGGDMDRGRPYDDFGGGGHGGDGG